MPMYLVERYLGHDATSDVHDDARRLTVASGDGPGPRLLWCVLAAEDATVLSVFEGDDEGEVADLNRRCGVRVDRISEVVVLH